jgi:hypothetical protein
LGLAFQARKSILEGRLFLEKQRYTKLAIASNSERQKCNASVASACVSSKDPVKTTKGRRPAGVMTIQGRPIPAFPRQATRKPDARIEVRFGDTHFGCCCVQFRFRLAHPGGSGPDRKNADW